MTHDVVFSKDTVRDALPLHSVFFAWFFHIHNTTGCIKQLHRVHEKTVTLYMLT